jgi:hypothetical protein
MNCRSARTLGLLLLALPLLPARAEPVPPLVTQGRLVEDSRIKPPPRTVWIDALAAGLPLRRAKMELINEHTGESSTIQADNFGKAKPVIKAGVPHTLLLTHEGYMVQAITNVLDGRCYRIDAVPLGPADGWKRLRRNGPSELNVSALGTLRVAGSWKSQHGEGINLFVVNELVVEGRLGLPSETPGEYHLYENETYRGIRGRTRTRFAIATLVPNRGPYLIYQGEAK